MFRIRYNVKTNDTCVLYLHTVYILSVCFAIPMCI